MGMKIYEKPKCCYLKIFLFSDENYINDPQNLACEIIWEENSPLLLLQQ